MIGIAQDLSELYGKLPKYTTGKHRVKKADAWLSVDDAEFRSQISSYDQITVNTSNYKNAIIFDIDDPDRYAPPELTPYTSTFNMHNDKSHQLFLLDEPIYTKSPKQKEWYKDHIQAPLEKITYLINADTNYKNTATKNPFSDQYRTNAHGRTLGSVFDLISLYSADLSDISSLEVQITKDGRYTSPLFRKVIAEMIEHSMINQDLLVKDKDPDQYETVMEVKALMLCDEIKTLTPQDALMICQDVISTGKSLARKYSDKQRHRVGKRWNGQGLETQEKIISSIRSLRASGSKVTYAQISFLSGLSQSTVRNYSDLVKKHKALR